MDDYIEGNFNVINDDYMGKVVGWNNIMYTKYEYFLQFFGEIIQKSMDEGWEKNELMKQLIIESIKKNYGLAESIITYSDISIF